MTQPERKALSPAGFEPVLIEEEWYDGPRSGIAEIAGTAHYFEALGDLTGNPPTGEFAVWPVADPVLALEREQWAIFIAWNARRGAGTADVDSHPGHAGVDARYDELAAILAPHRVRPDIARTLVAEVGFTDEDRYSLGGTDYLFRWHRP